MQGYGDFFEDRRPEARRKQAKAELIRELITAVRLHPNVRGLPHMQTLLGFFTPMKLGEDTLGDFDAEPMAAAFLQGPLHKAIYELNDRKADAIINLARQLSEL